MEKKIRICNIIFKTLIIAAIAVLCGSSRGASAEGGKLKTEVPKDYVVNLATQSEAENGLYNRFFLKDDIQEIRITIDEDNLKYLFANAADKVSVLADKVKIGDETVMYAGLKTKGDYTLAHGVSDNHSNIYSFTINFGKYVKKSGFGYKQNFFGLRKLSLNNFFFDRSMLKEFTAYYLIDKMRLPVSQYGLAKLYINDRYWGVYFMVEAFDYSVLEQYYDTTKDKLGSFLTKPVGTDLEYNDIVRDPGLLWGHDEETYEDVSEDVPMVIESIRKLGNLSSGLDFEGNAIDVNSAEYIELLGQVMDLDEVLRYFAVHSFLVQTDNMFTVQHNYGLYCDPQGRLVVIPWDYDLSYGTYFPSTADNTANYDVDIMYSMNGSWQDYNNREYSEGVYSQFPLFRVIFQNDELMERYHTYMLDCAKIASLGGTTSDKRYYEPANMYGIIEKLSGELIAAASIANYPGASYMNRINQPSAVKKAIPNIEKIIACRAVGVYSQLSGEGSWVACTDCDLSAVGNGMKGQSRKIGLLTAVDETTGVFTTATYQNSAPKLGVGISEPDSGLFADLLSSAEKTVGSDIENELKNIWADRYGREYVRKAQEDAEYAIRTSVYVMEDKGNAVSGYRIAVPLDSAFEKGKDALVIYSVDEDNNLSKLEYSRDGNLVFFDSETLGTFILAQKKIPKPDEDESDGEFRIGFKDTLFVAGIAVTVFLLFLGAFGLAGKIRKKTKKNESTEAEDGIQENSQGDSTGAEGEKQENSKDEKAE
ncbi:MAG: CotH kinase family protein [Lachnospiraceae bacterium]|nr:CotH kinase family protein [Lachnospiraceae bacterium]